MGGIPGDTHRIVPFYMIVEYRYTIDNRPDSIAGDTK